MTELMEIAIERIRALPPERQDEYARVLLDLAESGDVYVLTPEEEASFAEAFADIEAGRLVSSQDMQSVWKKHGG